MYTHAKVNPPVTEADTVNGTLLNVITGLPFRSVVPWTGPVAQVITVPLPREVHDDTLLPVRPMVDRDAASIQKRGDKLAGVHRFCERDLHLLRQHRSISAVLVDDELKV
jgi:hypothetical protein